MRIKPEKQDLTDDDEEKLAADVRRLEASRGPAKLHGPPDQYWQNLILRTNARIDDATGGRALSISWAARVAIPGVIAVVSFLIALHYYVPETPNNEVSVSSVVLSLPSAAIDSILQDPSHVDPILSVADVGGDVLDVSREQIVDYLIASGNATAAMEGLTDREAQDLFAVLSTGNDDSNN